MFLVVKGFHEEEGRIRVLRGVVGGREWSD